MTNARLLLWMATLVSMCVIAINVFYEPLPGLYALLAMAALLLVYAGGGMFPHFEMFGEVLWKGPEEYPCVALCFVATEGLFDHEPVLRMLKEQSVPATFFLSLPALRTIPPSRFDASPHDLGLCASASLAERRLKPMRALKYEVEEGLALLHKRFDKKPIGFAPGRGWLGPEVFALAKRNGLRVVDLSLCPRAQEQALQPGSLIAVSLNVPEGLNVAERLLREAAEAKLELVPLRTWL